MAPIRRRLDELGAGLGPAAVPYSQAPPEESPFMSMLDPNKQNEALAFLQGNQTEEDPENPVVDDPTQEDMGAGGPMPASPDGPTSDQLSDEDLASMGTGTPGQDPEVAQVLQALEDPNTPPQVKQRIEMMLSMAARRRMAGIQA